MKKVVNPPTSTVRLYKKDKEFLDFLISEGECKNIAECLEKMISPHATAKKYVQMYCARCGVEIPFSYARDTFHTHCSECRLMAIKEEALAEVEEKKFL